MKKLKNPDILLPLKRQEWGGDGNYDEDPHDD
jgi:hypothetical protein